MSEPGYELNVYIVRAGWRGRRWRVMVTGYHEVGSVGGTGFDSPVFFDGATRAEAEAKAQAWGDRFFATPGPIATTLPIWRRTERP